MKANDKEGVIYILTNPSFPEYVKIGYARHIESRVKQLNRSETIPYAFRVYAVYHVQSSLTDKELHKLIDKLNPDLRAVENFGGKKRTREFYALSAEDAYGLLESIAKISGTAHQLHRVSPDGSELLEERQAEERRKEARRGPFRFSQCRIPVGSELQFIQNPALKIKVIDDRRVQYGETVTSLSALARELTGTSYNLQGTKWFRYNGEILSDLRDKLEKNPSKN